MPNLLIYAVKGMLVGVSFLVPGLSGGTMMIVLDIFDESIHALNELIHGRFYMFKEMVMVIMGAILGIIFLTPLLNYLLSNHKTVTVYYFLGVIIRGIVELRNKVNLRHVKLKDGLFFLLGVVFVMLMTSKPTSNAFFDGEYTLLRFFLIVLAGIPISVALILPGISTSFLLLTFGLYEIVLQSIQTFDLKILVPLIIGNVVGIILLTGLLENQLKHHTQRTYLMIIGFVIASLYEVLAEVGLPTPSQWLPCIIAVILGMMTIAIVKKINKSPSR